jgi:hypothetical protein
MKQLDLKDKLEKIPLRIENSIEMTDVNSPTQIFDGIFEIHLSKKVIPIKGTITFFWYPRTGVYFEGYPDIELKDLVHIGHENDDLIVFVNGLECGKGFISSINYGSKGSNSLIKGTFANRAVIGDNSISVNKFLFSIPNLREFHGQLFKVINDDGIFTSRGRITLENDDYLIIIDKSKDYKNLSKSLHEKGGFLILYDGEISGKKGPMTFEDSNNIVHCLGAFLSFLNGRRTSPFFIHGIYEKEVKWCNYTNYIIDDYKSVHSWPQRLSIKGIETIWRKFYLLWKDSDNRNFITSFIHWYVESNGNSGFTDGAIIMAQTNLELLYNWWIVEDKKMITGKDSENISASNKIRLLLSQIGADTSVPVKFNELNKFVKGNTEINDAPEAIVQIRNAIVHSQNEKRKKLSKIHFLAKYEALQLSLWYMELSLLRILGFQEKYFSRCSNADYISQAEEIVPWKN